MAVLIELNSLDLREAMAALVRRVVAEHDKIDGASEVLGVSGPTLRKLCERLGVALPGDRRG